MIYYKHRAFAEVLENVSHLSDSYQRICFFFPFFSWFILKGFFPVFLMKKMAAFVFTGLACHVQIFPCLNEAIGMIGHLDIDLDKSSTTKAPTEKPTKNSQGCCCNGSLPCPKSPKSQTPHPRNATCLVFNSKFLDCTKAHHTAHHHDLG